MIISKKQMQVIVEELENTIGKNINIMDENGCIIASTDEKRIGHYHTGAIKVIKENLEELVISENECYEGARKGINLPIVIENEIVGVVGISGEEKNVAGFGKVIKKMTEILIMDSYKSSQKKLADTTKNNFVFSWLFGNEDEIDNVKALRTSGQLVGIDIDLSRIVMILSVACRNPQSPEAKNEMERQRLQNRITRTIEKMLAEKNADAHNIVLQLGWKIVTFFDSTDLIKTRALVEELASSIQKQYKVYTYCGIGTVGSDNNEIRRSFREADMACSIASKQKTSYIKSYGDVDMKILIESISDHDKNMFIQRVFKNCKEEDINYWVNLLRCYVENNESINKTAECMYIHKNTLQYRLGKLKEITGYDPRNVTELVPLYIVMLMWELGKNNNL